MDNNNQDPNGQFSPNQYDPNQYNQNQYGGQNYGQNQYNQNQYGGQNYGQNQYNQNQYGGQNNQMYGGQPQAPQSGLTYDSYSDSPLPQYQNPSNIPQPQPQKSNGNMGLIIGIIGGCIGFICIVALVFVLLRSKKEDTTVSTAPEVTEQVTTVEEESFPDILTEEITEAETEEETEETTEEAKKPSSSPDGLSDDLFSEEVYFDGKVFHLPFDYAEIKNDYTFNLADYGYSDGYILNPNDKVTSTVHLKNDKYDDEFDCTVGFMNTGSEAKDIMETQVWAIDADITWTDSSNYPEVILPKGITWGSTVEDVKAAYGEPTSDPYYAESLGYWEYSYEDDNNDYQVRLTIYDDRGLTAIALHSYKAD